MHAVEIIDHGNHYLSSPLILLHPIKLGRFSRPCYIKLMEDIISISLDEAMGQKLDHLVKIKNSRRSDLVLEAIKKYIFIEEMKNTRNQFLPYAEKAGFFSEDDIFENSP